MYTFNANGVGFSGQLAAARDDMLGFGTHVTACLGDLLNVDPSSKAADQCRFIAPKSRKSSNTRVG
jgi:hypothetical protein